MKQTRVLYWFRHDLRLSDNPALSAAAQQGHVLPIYINTSIKTTNKTSPVDHEALGAASQVWLRQALIALNQQLDQHLSCFEGEPLTIIKQLCEQLEIDAVYWNRCYSPAAIARDKLIKQELQQQGIDVHSYNGSLLWEPWTIKKADGSPYRVFTPFYRKGCLAAAAPRVPLAVPESINYIAPVTQALQPEQLSLLPMQSEGQWPTEILKYWTPGAIGATEQLNQFLQHGIQHYKDGRNFPAKPYVSALSPYLAHGEISPNQVWYAVRAVADDQHVDHFCSELGWREFSYYLLYYFPKLSSENLQTKFDQFPWLINPAHLIAWQQGNTGIPMVDAGMRQLWQTGYVHNRVRMIVGSFLVKNLRLAWQQGAAWFWDCLVDADLASNSASWQWVAGSGADAAPYFRIFNPVTQGEKFDPDGDYIRQYIPALRQLPTKYLFAPWTAPDEVLAQAGIKLGVDYPMPIVDLKQSRQAALDAFASLKQ